MVDLKTLDTKSLILDMTTNLSRIGNFVLDENYDKAEYFLQHFNFKYGDSHKKPPLFCSRELNPWLF